MGERQIRQLQVWTVPGQVLGELRALDPVSTVRGDADDFNFLRLIEHRHGVSDGSGGARAAVRLTHGVAPASGKRRPEFKTFPEMMPMFAIHQEGTARERDDVMSP